ncbi:hypothetical protein JZ751_007578 [Albula glossodonta]|uniref:UDENN domain-containing protein n=1 Tax=Albula glossodonta TaxID=121402 RepID=A0A8T2N235_9TELE|nr:hypothetical protein JZ751_007578 [Albula glossodonta]
MAMIYPFMQSLREAPFPAPGHTVKIKSFIPESGTEIISLTRPLDSWLEHVDFRTLFRCLRDEEVLQVFAATVMERRIVFIAEELGTLSEVINAVAALLYPFTWQHTFIPIVPEILIDVVMAPTPYLLGVQKRLLQCVIDQPDTSDREGQTVPVAWLLSVSVGIILPVRAVPSYRTSPRSDQQPEDADCLTLLVVDLSEVVKNTFIIAIGDEKSILPTKLQEEILLALSARKDNSTLEELNRVVSEAFLPFFVKTVGHYASYVKRDSSGEPGVFQQRSFYKAIESKTTRHFVKKFIQTQMFDLFIQEVEQQPESQEGLSLTQLLLPGSPVPHPASASWVTCPSPSFCFLGHLCLAQLLLPGSPVPHPASASWVTCASPSFCFLQHEFCPPGPLSPLFLHYFPITAKGLQSQRSSRLMRCSSVLLLTEVELRLEVEEFRLEVSVVSEFLCVPVSLGASWTISLSLTDLSQVLVKAVQFRVIVPGLYLSAVSLVKAVQFRVIVPCLYLSAVSLMKAVQFRVIVPGLYLSAVSLVKAVQFRVIVPCLYLSAVSLMKAVQFRKIVPGLYLSAISLVKAVQFRAKNPPT